MNETEYQECVNKAMAPFRAIDMAESGELSVSGSGGEQ